MPSTVVHGPMKKPMPDELFVVACPLHGPLEAINAAAGCCARCGGYPDDPPLESHRYVPADPPTPPEGNGR